nr:MAG TPA: hypothetical protein [Caudoviricetes sp.]
MFKTILRYRNSSTNLVGFSVVLSLSMLQR